MIIKAVGSVAASGGSGRALITTHLVNVLITLVYQSTLAPDNHG